MNHMFNNCYNLKNINLSKFDTAKVTEMQAMFQRCTELTNLDLTSFNTSNLVDMGYMFYGCTKLTNIDLSTFVFSSVTTSSDVFGNVPINSLIYVKDNASKEFILGVRSDLSNVQIKNV